MYIEYGGGPQIFIIQNGVNCGLLTQEFFYYFPYHIKISLIIKTSICINKLLLMTDDQCSSFYSRIDEAPLALSLRTIIA